ncbi:MAG: alpha/beta fold hydrolase [Candidatus Dormibacteraeota bacterium]|nr:alpha/beta fold hydrolase [Candidatus Dormibacteraeota bacterium]
MHKTLAVPVELAGPGAGMLRGLRFGDGERWAVLVHDLERDLDDWRELAIWLAESGVCALALDLPGHGASDDPWDPALAVPAAKAALDFARSAGAGRIHLVGAGVGGTAALAAASSSAGEVASAALLSPRPDDAVAAMSDLREARVARLILVGSLDQGALTDAEAVFRASIGQCELAQIPVSAQGAGLLSGEWGGQSREKVLAHMVRHR